MAAAAENEEDPERSRFLVIGRLHKEPAGETDGESDNEGQGFFHVEGECTVSVPSSRGNVGRPGLRSSKSEGWLAVGFRQMRFIASLAPCHAFVYQFPMSGVLAQLPEVFDQESFNLERWSELAADPMLAALDGRLETNRFGQIIMIPLPGF